MSQARIAQSGTPTELYDWPETRFVADFIGGANLVECEILAVDAAMAKVRLGMAQMSLPHRGLVKGKATMAIRPNAIRLLKDPKASPLTAVVRKATYLGSHLEYTLDSDLGELFAIDPNTDAPLAAGQRAPLGFAARGLALVKD
jgi:iron(III) transport system ATP-binding protein